MPTRFLGLIVAVALLGGTAWSVRGSTPTSNITVAPPGAVAGERSAAENRYVSSQASHWRACMLKR